jgi:hypothetical protein
MEAKQPGPEGSIPTVAEPEVYEPPRITTLGSLADLTRGRSSNARTDGTFPGSIFT